MLLCNPAVARNHGNAQLLICAILSTAAIKCDVRAKPDPTDRMTLCDKAAICKK